MSQIQKTTTFSHINPVFALFCRLFSYFGRFLTRGCWVVLAVITIINIASTVKYHSIYYTGFPYIEVIQSLIASVLAFQVLYFMHKKSKLGSLDQLDGDYIVFSTDSTTVESRKSRRFLGIPPFKEWDLACVTIIVVLVVATVSATYITMCQFYDLSDLKAIIKVASHYQTWFTTSNPNSVSHISHIEHDYMQKYPYQSGMVWFVWLITMVIPYLEVSSLMHIMITLQYVMIPFVCASIFLIVSLAYYFSGNNEYVAKIAAMLCLFFPVFPVISQEVYGYNISMPFILGVFLLAFKCYRALKDPDGPDFGYFWRCFTGFVILAAILGFVKPNNMIVGIALAMGLILAAVFSSKLFNTALNSTSSSVYSGNGKNSGKNGSGRLFARLNWANIKSSTKVLMAKPTVLLVLTAIIVLPSMSLGSNIAQSGFTQVTGMNFPANRRQKIAPFLAIGLGNRADGRMGFYDAKIAEFKKPVETINSRGEKMLKTRLSDFTNNPSEAIHFFVLKTVQTWGDPTFLFFENPPRLTFIHFQELKEKAEEKEKAKKDMLEKDKKKKELKKGVKNKPISMFENAPDLEFSAKNAANPIFDPMKYGAKSANYRTVNDNWGSNAHIVKPVGMGIGNMVNNSSNSSWYTTNLLNPMNPISPLYPHSLWQSDDDDNNGYDYSDYKAPLDDDNDSKNPVLSHDLKKFTISTTRKVLWNDFSAFVYTFWCDIMVSLIMIGTMLGFGAIMAKNKGNSYLDGKKWVIMTPIIALFGGFLFHMVWETKPPYAFYYFIYLIPFAAIGLYYSKNANTKQMLDWVFCKKSKEMKEAEEKD